MGHKVSQLVLEEEVCRKEIRRSHTVSGLKGDWRDGRVRELTIKKETL